MLIERKDVDLIDDNWFVSLPQLIICGGGHIAYEIARIASFLEYKICIIDDPEEFANSNRFSFVDQVVYDSFSHLKQYLVPNAYYVVMASRHKDDYKCVETILQSSYSYLEMIGSYKKVHTLLERLRHQGYDERLIDSIHASIGLNFHASTPLEIAISILEEIIQEKIKKSIKFISRTFSHKGKRNTLYYY